MNACPNCGMIRGLHASILPGCMCPSTPQDTFIPDYNTEAVLVEEMQRMAKQIADMKSEQEPVAYINVEKRSLEWASPTRWLTPTVAKMERVALYTAPPQRQPLTDEEIDEIVDAHTSDDGQGYEIWCDGRGVARAIEAKLKEKNT